MALASHIGEYFGKTLVLEQWGYENCQESGISCWNHLYEVPCSGWFSPSRVEFRELAA